MTIKKQPVVDALDRNIDAKTSAVLRRLLKRDKISLREFMRRCVIVYDFIYPGAGYLPGSKLD